MRFVGLGWLPILILAGLLLAAGAALAQPCQSDLRPADDNFGYRHRPSPDRCEGLYSAPVAGEGLEMLSYLIGRPTFNPRTDDNLLIIAPDVHSLGAAQVLVVARALPLRVYYRMDTALASGASMRWPVSEVVVPAGLNPGNIGLIGKVQTEGATVYVPLLLSPSERDTSQAASPPVITFRATQDLQSFQWRLYAAGEAAPAWNKYGSDVHAGDPIALTLPAPPGKVTTLYVAARPAGSPFIQQQYKIFRP
jgi:hypothetical protein